MDLLRRFANPENAGAQYIEDLSTAYWLSESLFAALDTGLFDYLEEGAGTSAELALKTGTEPEALCRFLHVLEQMKLVGRFEDSWYNTRIASKYLTAGSPLSQTGNVSWRRALKEDWAALPDTLRAGGRVRFPESLSEKEMDARRRDYLSAMDAVVRPKLREILPMLPVPAESERPCRILDLGCGSGAFSAELIRYFGRSGTCAELCDIRQIVGITEEMIRTKDPDAADRTVFTALNLLDDEWELKSEQYDLILLSNIVHAYDGESEAVLRHAARLLSDDGILLLHDFFLEHDPLKSSLSDINMLINTYNGRSFSCKEIADILKQSALFVSPLIPLSGDTSVLFAAQSAEPLCRLNLNREQRIISPILDAGFDEVIPIDPEDIAVSEFAPVKCHFGCRSGGSKTCSVNDEMTPEELRTFLSGYSKAFLLTGEPPTDEFQRRALAAETAAFKAGFYKAFVFWAGPCSICPDCDPEEPCRNRTHHRPSMEGSGIDVFETARRAGVELKTLSERGEYIRYLSLLMLE